MEAQEELLRRFATMIDLPAFVGQQGFQLGERQEPGRLSMVHRPTGETLWLERDVDRGGWTYTNAADPHDRGTVVDYLQRRGASRAACLDRLIACCDRRARGTVEAERYQEFVRAMPEDLRRALNEHEQHKLAEHATTKALERLGVPRGTLDESRFRPAKREADLAVLTDEPKVLWASSFRPGDRAVVLVERPIDAVAYERAHGRQSACYLATGSAPDPVQKKRLAHILAEAPDGMNVILAFGRDEAGRRLAHEIQAVAPMIHMKRHAPELGARWADQMQLERRHVASLQRTRAAIER